MYIYIYIYIYLLPDDDLWISNLLVDVGVSRTKLGCTVLSAASWIVSYCPKPRPSGASALGPGSLSAYHLALLSHRVGLTGLSQGSSNAQSKGLTLHQHTHNTDTNTTQVGQVKLCIRSGPVPPFFMRKSSAA